MLLKLLDCVTGMEKWHFFSPLVFNIASLKFILDLSLFRPVYAPKDFLEVSIYETSIQPLTGIHYCILCEVGKVFVKCISNNLSFIASEIWLVFYESIFCLQNKTLFSGFFKLLF